MKKINNLGLNYGTSWLQNSAFLQGLWTMHMHLTNIEQTCFDRCRNYGGSDFGWSRSTHTDCFWPAGGILFMPSKLVQ